jgi:hypothetical protein
MKYVNVANIVASLLILTYLMLSILNNNSKPIPEEILRFAYCGTNHIKSSKKELSIGSVNLRQDV